MIFTNEEYLQYIGSIYILSVVLVYVIGWQAVVFGINSASIVNRKE